MKNIVILIVSLFVGSQLLSAQKTDTIKIETSAQCEMCKERIETALEYESGVKSAILDEKTKVLTVVFNSAKTKPEKIKTAVSMTGYDADEMAADPKAYSKLPGCCKKP